MLLSDAPTLEDAAAGQPIGGAAWELAKNMLRAIGLSVDQAYSASLNCFHAPGARMTDGIGHKLARHQQGLVTGALNDRKLTQRVPYRLRRIAVAWHRDA